MVIISVIQYSFMSNPHVKSYVNPPLPQFFCLSILVECGQTRLCKSILLKKRKIGDYLMCLCVAIDWVDEAVCHQGLIKLFISLLYFRQEIPQPLCNSVQRHIPMHLGIASPSHTHVHCTLLNVYTLFKATRCLRGQIAKLCLFKTLNPQNHTLFSGDTHYQAK